MNKQISASTQNTAIHNGSGLRSHKSIDRMNAGSAPDAKAEKATISNSMSEPMSASKSVEVHISEAGRNAALAIREYDPITSELKLDSAFFSREAIEQRKAGFLESGVARQESAALVVFENGTAERLIADALNGKVSGASLVAQEIGQMIRSAGYHNGATVEERAANRESALRMATYLAENYFDDSDEAKAFLDGIHRFAENDILRDKGYRVIEGYGLAADIAYIIPKPEHVDWGVAYARLTEKYQMFLNEFQGGDRK